MTTISEAYEAAVDAVIADNTLAKSGFRDAIKTVATTGLSNAETTAWIDALVIEYDRLGISNAASYSSFRSEIVNEGKVTAMAQFDALQVSIGALPESGPVVEELLILDLRDERDQINGAIDRLDVLIGVEPAGTQGRLVKEVMRDGKRSLRVHKQSVRDQIQNLTNDPDS
jgi:hypothetical protein